MLFISVIETKEFEVIFQDGKARLRPRGFISIGVVIGVREHGLRWMMGKLIDHEKTQQVPEAQKEPSSSGSVQVQRENLQPNNAWLVGSKGTSTTGKKESWDGMKAYQKRKKKHEDFGGRDTIEMSVVHSIGYATVVNAKSWASVANDDDDGIFPSGRSSYLAKREC